ncbi:hypothetical protein [Microbacterium hominis]|uniref:Lipoprotein n=1 Tax=Microbacterium hominis TaxID=162426 RepID=A0A0B4C9Q9_9MICO|nr:hypothetical protein [Microbacterium hominis]KIC57889.1 hypothetical protein RM52_07290 [Microbacterium hominis]
MTPVRKIVVVGLSAALAVGLSGCTMNELIWGADGAHVIDTTQKLIAAAAAGEAAALACPGSQPDVRDPADWEGLTAEEPERFVAAHWPEMAPHDPTWSINLSLPASGAVAGAQYPGDVFYREAGGELCLVDIAWWTVQ